MSKQETIGDILSTPPRMGESGFVEEVEEKLKKLDAYERVHGFICNHCPDEANWHPADEIFPDDECGDLCEACLKEEEKARDAIEAEKKFHHKGRI